MEYLLDHHDIKYHWDAFVKHEFVRKIADGSLDVELFKEFLLQDYLFLV